MITHLVTSESVSEGHPDKVADQLSDAVLDHILEQDPNARVACETYVKSGLVLIGGEVSTHARLDLETVARATLRSIGYTQPELGLDADACAILSNIGKQSVDIKSGIEHAAPTEQGAGDQGVMIGYATDETEAYMPAPILYAHRLMMQHASIRKNKKLPWLRPDAKVQLTLAYENDAVTHIDACVLSTQHDPYISTQTLQEAVIEEVIRPILPPKWQTEKTRYFINPAGRFVIGGPIGDCGLTGRKIMVDTYGSVVRHGGGAFSGKDPSKVDRSGAYMARYIAKNIVAARLAKRCEVEIAYAIGMSKPIVFKVETFGTGLISSEALTQWLQPKINLTPYTIIQHLKLLTTRYQPTAAYGHFGRNGFSWECTDLASLLADQFGSREQVLDHQQRVV